MGSYRIWSNQHGAWWRPNHLGYTQVIEWAGVYSEAEAQEILARTSLDEPREVEDSLGVYPKRTVPNEVLVPLGPAAVEEPVEGREDNW